MLAMLMAVPLVRALLMLMLPPRALRRPAVSSETRMRLVTVTPFSTDGSAEVAGASTDLVLARHQGRLHVFHRDPDDHGRLAPGTPDGKDVRDTLVSLIT